MPATPRDAHDPLPDCDCHACALAERDRLRKRLQDASSAAPAWLDHVDVVDPSPRWAGYLSLRWNGVAIALVPRAIADQIRSVISSFRQPPAPTAEPADRDDEDGPTFTDQRQALEFLAGRMEFAGIADAAARAYAKELRRLLAGTAPGATQSWQPAVSNLMVFAINKHRCDELGNAVQRIADMCTTLEHGGTVKAPDKLCATCLDFIRKQHFCASHVYHHRFSSEDQRSWALLQGFDDSLVTAAIRVEPCGECFPLEVAPNASGKRASTVPGAAAMPAAASGAIITEVMLGQLIFEALNEGVSIEVMNKNLQQRATKLSAALTDILARFMRKVAPAGNVVQLSSRDADLARVAMRFVDRAGDPCPDTDPAERICADFYAAMTAVLASQPAIPDQQVPSRDQKN